MTSREELSFWIKDVVPVEPGQNIPLPEPTQVHLLSPSPQPLPPSTHYTIVWKTDAGVEVTLSFHYVGEFSHCDHSWHMTTFNLNLNSQLAQPGFWTVINLPRGLHFDFLHREQKDEQSNPNLTVLSWNVDGLDERNILERTRNVCHIINNRKPDAVFLQEVITQTLAIYQSKCPG